MCYSLWYNAPTMLPAGSVETEELFFQATARQLCGCIVPTSCNTQSSSPEDGQNNYPKIVELIGIINKPLLLNLVGFLCYLFTVIK